MNGSTARRSSVLRGVGVLVALVIGAGALSPAFGAATVTKAKVKKIATKIANNAAEDAVEGVPVAYAHVLTNGTVVSSESRRLSTSNFSKQPAASFCLSGAPAFKSIQATPDYVPGDGDEDLTVKIGLPGSGFVGGCPGGSQAEIVTVVDSVFLHHGFYVTLFA